MPVLSKNVRGRLTNTVFLGLGIAVGTVIFVPIVSNVVGRIRTALNI